MTNRRSSFGHFVDAAKGGDMGQPYHFVKEFSMSDIEFFKKILKDAEKIDVHITWGFDEQQADPFHKGISSTEFVRRLKRLVEGNPKTYGKETVEHRG